MTRWLRIVVVWLLALALPAQAVAAATMAHCGASHGRMHAAAAMSAAHALAAGQQQRAQLHDHGHHHGAAAAPDTAASAAPHPDAANPAGADGFPELGQYKCAACAACCSVAALPAFALIVPAPTPTLDWQAVSVCGHIVFVTDGPERPPRSFLA